MINSSAILEINTKNFLYNYKSLAKISNKSLAGATIKANAYGLGDIKIFNILYNNGCRHFFVATIEEALKIRKKNSKGNLYVLNSIDENEIKLSKEKKIGAIGLRIKKWITYHGLSFNIEPDLTYYQNIHACGLPNYSSTSLKELGVKLSQKEFDQIFMDIFNKKLKSF